MPVISQFVKRGVRLSHGGLFSNSCVIYRMHIHRCIFKYVSKKPTEPCCRIRHGSAALILKVEKFHWIMTERYRSE